MRYQVRTIGADGRVSCSTLEAADDQDARRQAEQGTDKVLSIEPAARAAGWRFPLSRAGRFSVVLFSQELLALLNAGLSVVEGLEALIEKDANDGARAVLCRLLDGLREGKRLSDVLGEQPQLFPPLYVGVVQAAEETSNLPRSLARYVQYRERVDHVRGKIASASIYPVILLGVGSLVSLFLIAYVVPRFAEVYRGAGRSVPWMSQLLLRWGEFASSHAHALVPMSLAILFVTALAVRKAHASGAIHAALLSLPGIRDKVRIFELSRLYLTLGMLLEGGIPIVSALHTVHGTVSASTARLLSSARTCIENGQSLSDAFMANGLTTPISLRMLRVGEKSGAMGEMLTQSAAFYDGEVSRWIDRFTRAFEPLLMAAIGLVVGTIVVLLYMPIFDLAGSLS